MPEPNTLKTSFLEKVEKLNNFYNLSQNAISRQTGISVNKIRNAQTGKPYKVTRVEITKLESLIEVQKRPNQPIKDKDEQWREDLEMQIKRQQEQIDELKRNIEILKKERLVR